MKLKISDEKLDKRYNVGESNLENNIDEDFTIENQNCCIDGENCRLINEKLTIKNHENKYDHQNEVQTERLCEDYIKENKITGYFKCFDNKNKIRFEGNFVNGQRHGKG